MGECSGNTGQETCTAGLWGDDTCDPFAGATAEIECDAIDQDCDGSDFCVPSPFDFEELEPTFVDDGESPPPGALTSLSSTRSGITIDISRENNLAFDTGDNTSGSQIAKPASFGDVSLDPFYDFSNSAFIVNFSIPVSSVSVDMGDYNTVDVNNPQDDDVLTLVAYPLADAAGAPLDRDQIDLPDD